MTGKVILEKCRLHSTTLFDEPTLVEMIDAALAAEREACCKDVCPGCRDGLELSQTWVKDGTQYDLWLHLNRETLQVTPCYCSAIRARRTP
jgi:hypothetical protein